MVEEIELSQLTKMERRGTLLPISAMGHGEVQSIVSKELEGILKRFDRVFMELRGCRQRDIVTTRSY